VTARPPAPAEGEGQGGGAGDPGAVAVVVAVGDELLSGRTVDTNAAFLGRVLAAAGVPVIRRLTVGDREVDIMEGVGAALALADLVVVTGGLGPTHDDRTLDAVARYLDRTLEVDQGLVEALRQRFLSRGHRELPPSNLRQARVPAGAQVLQNSRGSAPGMLLEAGGRWVVLLPGVPGEMETLMTQEVLPRLQRLLAGRLRPMHTRVIRTTGVAESVLAGGVEAAMARGELGPVTVAFLPRTTGVEVRLTAREEGEGVADDRAEALLDLAERRLAPLVDGWRYAGPDLVDDVADALLSRGLRMSTAESCTGGLLGKRLTDRPGSSAWYVGGIVAYDNALKLDLLGVDPRLLDAHGAVSEPVARAMAQGAARRLRVPVGVAVTGVAGPGGGTEEKPVGTVWMAAQVEDRAFASMGRFTGDREDIRERSAQGALHLLLRALEGRI
jgi:nicotinamide-nucleotide amidase